MSAHGLSTGPCIWDAHPSEQDDDGGAGGETCLLDFDDSLNFREAAQKMPCLPKVNLACEERQDSWKSTDFITSDPVYPASSVLISEAAGATDPEEASEAPKKKARRGRGGKRRVTAEEKDAKIRARNRRAQQAFRKRQKALAMERSSSLTRLEAEVMRLRDANRDLQQRLQDTQDGLTKERALNANIAQMSQQQSQDLQMMGIFEEPPPLPPAFPPPRSPFDNYFSVFWGPQTDVYASNYPSSGLPLQN